MNENGSLVSTDEEKAEVLNRIFASVFPGNLSPHPSPVDGLQSPSPCNGRPGLGPPEEPEHT